MTGTRGEIEVAGVSLNTAEWDKEQLWYTQCILGINGSFTVIMIMTTVVWDFHRSILFQRFLKGMYSHLEKAVCKTFNHFNFSIEGEPENGWEF